MTVQACQNVIKQVHVSARLVQRSRKRHTQPLTT
jgi:hypothetical protein